jgi:uroporphyrinogen decarboxylase
MNKREFLKSSIYAAGGAGLGIGSVATASAAVKETSQREHHHAAAKVDKREKVLEVLDQSKPNKYVPSAFFMHFPEKLGQGAVKKHLDYFRATNMDFSKIQYEVTLPPVDIQRPKDWEKVAVQGKDFFKPQLDVIELIAKELKSEALIIPTVYSPLLYAAQTKDGATFLKHAKEDPETMAKAFGKFAESIIYFLREAVRVGADGFYLSTHGGDTANFYDTLLFYQLIAPYDHLIFKEASDISDFNILHICSPENTYQKLDHLASYPSSVINPPALLADGSKANLKGVQALFHRPVMGGLDNHGVIAHGSPGEIKKEVDQIFADAPQNFILAANCTVHGDVSWETLRSVIDYAHDWRTIHS